MKQTNIRTRVLYTCIFSHKIISYCNRITRHKTLFYNWSNNLESSLFLTKHQSSGVEMYPQTDTAPASNFRQSINIFQRSKYSARFIIFYKNCIKIIFYLFCFPSDSSSPPGVVSLELRLTPLSTPIPAPALLSV